MTTGRDATCLQSRRCNRRLRRGVMAFFSLRDDPVPPKLREYAGTCKIVTRPADVILGPVVRLLSREVVASREVLALRRRPEALPARCSPAAHPAGPHGLLGCAVEAPV